MTHCIGVHYHLHMCVLRYIIRYLYGYSMSTCIYRYTMKHRLRIGWVYV